MLLFSTFGLFLSSFLQFPRFHNLPPKWKTSTCLRFHQMTRWHEMNLQQKHFRTKQSSSSRSWLDNIHANVLRHFDLLQCFTEIQNSRTQSQWIFTQPQQPQDLYVMCYHILYFIFYSQSTHRYDLWLPVKLYMYLENPTFSPKGVFI